MIIWRSTDRSGLLDRLCGAAAVVVFALVVAACGDDGGAGGKASPPSHTSAVASPSAATSKGADRAAVERVYRRFWVVSSTFARDYPEVQWKRVLGQVAADPQLSFTVGAARIQRRNGITVYGQPIPHPTVLPINGADTATVRDCQDASKTGQADRNGHPKTVGIPHNPVVATLSRTSEGWRVTRIHFPGGECS